MGGLEEGVERRGLQGRDDRLRRTGLIQSLDHRVGGDDGVLGCGTRIRGHLAGYALEGRTHARGVLGRQHRPDDGDAQSAAHLTHGVLHGRAGSGAREWEDVLHHRRCGRDDIAHAEAEDEEDREHDPQRGRELDEDEADE